MKIKTIDTLNDLIDKEYTWRFREIIDLKSLVSKTTKNTNLATALTKSLVVLSYAHFEGFVKYSSSYFYDYIHFLSLNQSQLSKKFLSASIRHLCDGRKASDAIEEIYKCLNDSSYKFSYNVNFLTSAESNLNFEVLKKISSNLGIDISSLETKKNLLDMLVLARRNECAHGEFVYCESNYGLEVANAVLDFMKSFKDLLQNMIAMQDFRLKN